MKKIIIFLILFLPILTNAEVKITEIMYNPDGTDSGREWIEIYNNGNSNIDLSAFKFTEGGTAHKLSTFNSDNLVLGFGEYAIIADNPEKFLLDYNFTGLLIDSTFSLNNTGETLEIEDSVTYSSNWGANGTGNSLQINDVDFWIPAEPTPGLENHNQAEGEGKDESSEENNSGSSHSGNSEISEFKPKPELQVYAGRDRYISINTPVELELEHNQGSGKTIRSVWNFGDGGFKSGRKVKHFYKNPGVYNIILNAKKGKEQAVSRAKIYVTEPTINDSLITSGKYVELLLENLSEREINLGTFIIKDINNEFEIPGDTIIDPGEELVLDREVLGFDLNEEYEILYPNGKLLNSI